MEHIFKKRNLQYQFDKNFVSCISLLYQYIFPKKKPTQKHPFHCKLRQKTSLKIHKQKFIVLIKKQF
jgi:hypothetical protein